MENIPEAIASMDRDILIRYRSDANWKMDRYHFHDMYEIYCSLTDGVEIFVNDSVYPAPVGTVFVFNTADIHRTISSSSAYNRYVIHFSPACIRALSTSETNLLDCFDNRGPKFRHSLHLSPDQLDELLALIQKAQHAEHKGYGQDVLLKVVLAEVLLFLNPLYSGNIEPPPVKSKREFQRIAPILDYIQQNLAGDLRLERLSEQCYISKYHLIDLFKKATGFTVSEYIIQRRILKACELLKAGVSVQRTGEAVGFNNNSHFIRTFKEHVGLPPKRYAKQFD